jgi:hypothetical protein
MGDAGPVLMGRQEPTFCWVPPYTSTLGTECVELAAAAGLVLDPWERFIVHEALAEDAAGRWQFFEVGLVVSRQNGKDAIFEALELAWLFLFGDRLIIHSAHLFDTAKEHFLRILALIDNHDDFRRRVRAVRKGKGDEQIELLGGQRLKFMTRKGGAGRGFTAGKLVMNEAMYLDAMMMASMLPTLAAMPNPQIWYGGSAGMRHSTQLAQVRRRGYARDDPNLAYFEWAVDERPVADGGDDRADPRSWAKANPGLGIRITVEHVRKEMAAMGGPLSPEFGQERLGIGDWPLEDEAWEVIAEDRWTDRGDPGSQIPDGATIALALDADGDREVGTIGVCGLRLDGRRHVEVIERHRGTSWMVDTVRRMVELTAKWRPVVVVVLPTSSAATCVDALRKAGVRVETPTEGQYAQACGAFFEAFAEADTARHRGQQSLDRAVAGGRKRPSVEGGWRWSRKLSANDVGPVVVATLAMWGLATFGIDVVEPWAFDGSQLQAPAVPAGTVTGRGAAALAGARRGNRAGDG